jgi:hypothetical protein
MRAPSPTFRAAFTFVRETVEEEMPAGPERELVLQMLKRGEDHGATDDIWKAITDAAVANDKPAPEAVERIEWLINSRLKCEEASLVVEQWPAQKAKLLTQVKRAWKGPVSEWSDAAVKGGAVEDFEARMNAVLGRKKKSGPRQRFMRLWTASFRDFCGDPLDEVVRVLTEIVFNEKITLDMVRRASRS